MAQRTTEPDRIAADPNQWSEKSKKSVAFEFNFIKEYIDISYNCWRCRQPSVFTAADQKYAYEVKKAYIDQRRILCNHCWNESNDIAGHLISFETRWSKSKNRLRYDREFLSQWLELVVRREGYVPYKHDTAKKNMLRKLLKQRP